MKAAAAVAEILKREGVEFLIGYPVNPIIEAAAEADIRTIIVRQERTGLHMADAVSRITSGEQIGVFAMQHGPGTENAFGGVAQAYGDSVPIVVLPGGYPRQHHEHRARTSTRSLNYQHVTKWCEQVIAAPTRSPTRCAAPSPRSRTAARARSLVEIPVDVCSEEVPEPLDYTPAPRAAHRRRTRRRSPRSRAVLVERRAAGDLRRPGRPLRARPGRSCASWPSCSRRR